MNVRLKNRIIELQMLVDFDSFTQKAIVDHLREKGFRITEPYFSLMVKQGIKIKNKELKQAIADYLKTDVEKIF